MGFWNLQVWLVFGFRFVVVRFWVLNLCFAGGIGGVALRRFGLLFCGWDW